MRVLNPKLGRWYESRSEVRAFYGEYWKGILLSDNSISIVFNYVGARRTHYGDHFDYENGRIRYVGEGKSGDQKENARNRALIQAVTNKLLVHVYLDCGDLFQPKRLLYAGKWRVVHHSYDHVTAAGRKLYLFDLEPADPEILKFLAFTFSAAGSNAAFEADLGIFANARRGLYEKHAGILRARDNIAGEIGEYFAIRHFNEKAGDKHLIRLSGSFKDIDAIRIGNGHRFAIKTVGSIPCATSNIWSRDIASAIDHFLICFLDPYVLKPRAVFSVAIDKALPFLKRDAHQGSQKLTVAPALAKAARFYLGSASDCGS